MQDDLQTDLRVRVSGLLAQQHDIGGLVDDSCNGDEQVPVQVDVTRQSPKGLLVVKRVLADLFKLIVSRQSPKGLQVIRRVLAD